MNNIFIKLLFSAFTLYVLLYCTSFAKYEFKQNKKTFASIFVFFFTLASVIFSNIIFWLN